MFFKRNDGQPGSAARRGLRLLALAGGVFALVIGISVYQRTPWLSSARDAAHERSDAAQAALDAASVKVEQGVVKFYFASGKAELAPGAGQALAEMVRGAQAGRKLVISGFHDPVGDPVKNAALAQRRALAVQEALTALGVARPQIEIRKPELTTGSGNNADARRVEISLQ